MNKEAWETIKDYPDYEISTLARVKSHKLGFEKILKPGLSSGGYLIVGLTHNKIQKSKCVHVLMAIAFLGHIPDGNKLVVDHINGNKLDNRLENLQSISHRENCSKDKKGISKHTGITWDKLHQKWKSRIMINGKRKHLGSFDSEIEAAKAYQEELNNI
ncbi:MAG: hypothetical protein GY928_18685 [Colwellia sp.]|nr:hypothetical protein [Colwellia sp.]